MWSLKTGILNFFLIEFHYWYMHMLAWCSYILL